VIDDEIDVEIRQKIDECAHHAAGALELESQFRNIWFNTRATVEMGAAAFAEYPAFARATPQPQYVSADTREIHSLPQLRHVRDRLALAARLRFVLEDPTQLASNCVFDYVVDQLADADYDPAKVFLVGFSDVDYSAARAAAVA
jgi:hypothetical protein